jgi:hypothetical protein
MRQVWRRPLSALSDSSSSEGIAGKPTRQSYPADRRRRCLPCLPGGGGGLSHGSTARVARQRLLSRKWLSMLLCTVFDRDLPIKAKTRQFRTSSAIRCGRPRSIGCPPRFYAPRRVPARSSELHPPLVPLGLPPEVCLPLGQAPVLTPLASLDH